jgi:hypothetical protein
MKLKPDEHWPDDQYEMFGKEERLIDRWLIGGMIFVAFVIAGLLIYVSYG